MAELLGGLHEHVAKEAGLTHLFWSLNGHPKVYPGRCMLFRGYTHLLR